MKYLAHIRLSFVTFSEVDIVKITRNLDSGKMVGHNKISIRILKICGPVIFKPLVIIFKQWADAGVFLSKWKTSNILPIHKKGDKQTLKNYCPVSLFSFSVQIIEE